jgi:hypothetical protein
MLYNSSTYEKASAILPPQMIPVSEKNDDWKQKMMDALENIGKRQYTENQKLLENYEMIKGKFIFQHYLDREDYADYINRLTHELNLPSYLRHYDIISQVINSLVGEQQARANIFKVRSHDENATSQYQRDKTQMLQDYVKNQIDTEVNRRLQQKGIDPNKKDFSSDEEAQAYQQQLDQAKQSLTPPEIEQYMQTNWFTAAEMWGEHQLRLDRDRFNIHEKEKEEFQDMLVADRCFRHFYMTSTGYGQETWNPIHVFFQKEKEVREVENGEFVGRTLWLSLNTIINRYGFMMTNDQIEMLRDGRKSKANNKWGYAAGTDYLDEYMVPYKGYYDFAVLHQGTGVLPNGELPVLNNGDLDRLNEHPRSNSQAGYYLVTEAYWMSVKKVYKINYIDPETGLPNIAFVDENVVIPPSFKEENSSIKDNNEPFTYVSTWIPEVWKGIKIRLKNGDFDKDLYLNVAPLEFQFKSNINPYGAKLPVCGQVFSTRNSESMSTVDLMKPYQIFHNVCMNQAYQIGEREIGHFMVFDINLFPKEKDWGGADAWKKLLLTAKEGLVPADTSPSNVQGALASGSFLPKDFNWDDTARMMNRLEMAEKFEQKALRQVGYNDYRVGAYASTSTAAGVQEGKSSSVNQTEYLFANFASYQRRCYEMNLAIAQYVQSQNHDIQVMYTKSDMSRAYIQLNGSDILLADLEVRVVDSREELEKTQMMRQYALENNTAGLDPIAVMEIISTDSTQEIKMKVKEAWEQHQQTEQQNYDLQRKQLESQQETQAAQLEQDNQHFYDKLRNDYEIAQIQAGTKVITSSDGDVPTQPQQQPTDYTQQLNNEQKTSLQQQKMLLDKEYNDKKLALEQRKLEQQLQLENKKLAVVKTMKKNNK